MACLCFIICSYHVVKSNFLEFLSTKKHFISVDMKYFKTEGKESCYFYYFVPQRTLRYVPVQKKAKYQNPKIFWKVNRCCLTLLCCYSGLHSPSQPAQTQHLELVSGSKTSGISYVIAFLSKRDQSFARSLFHCLYLQKGKKKILTFFVKCFEMC